MEEIELKVKIAIYPGQKGHTVTVSSEQADIAYGTGSGSFEGAFRDVGSYLDKKKAELKN